MESDKLIDKIEESYHKLEDFASEFYTKIKARKTKIASYIGLAGILLSLAGPMNSTYSSKDNQTNQISNNISYNNEENSNNYSDENKSEQDQKLAPLSNFGDKTILVACANEQEYKGVLQSFRRRNKRRFSRLKMTFTPRRNYMRITVPNETSNDSIKNSYIHVVPQNNLDEVLPIIERKGIKYDIVQMRGHGSEMKELYETVKDSSKEYSLFLFGGCSSANLAKELYTPKRAVLGGNGTQDTVTNTYHLMRIIDEMGSRGVNNWNDLEQKLLDTSIRFREFYIPPHN